MLFVIMTPSIKGFQFTVHGIGDEVQRKFETAKYACYLLRERLAVLNTRKSSTTAKSDLLQQISSMLNVFLFFYLQFNVIASFLKCANSSFLS